MNSDRPKIKNYLGMVFLIIGLTLYAFAAAAVGELLIKYNMFIQVIFYLFAGLIWIFPAYKLLTWMTKP